MAEREVTEEIDLVKDNGYEVWLVQHLGETVASIKFGHVIIWKEEYRHIIEPIEGTKDTKFRLWVTLDDNPLSPLY